MKANHNVSSQITMVRVVAKELNLKANHNSSNSFGCIQPVAKELNLKANHNGWPFSSCTITVAYLFGSAAKGTMKEDSDVDFILFFSNDMHYIAYTENYFAWADALVKLLQKK